MVDAGGSVVAHGVTDGRGRYRFGELAPGSYTVTSSGYGPTASRASVSGGRVAPVDLALGDRAVQWRSTSPEPAGPQRV